MTNGKGRPAGGGPRSDSANDRTGLIQAVNSITPIGKALDGTPAPKRRRSVVRGRGPGQTPVTSVFPCPWCPATFPRIYDAYAHVVAEMRAGTPRRADGRRYVAACGTRQGYIAHRKAGYQACDDCLRANREARQKWMADPAHQERHRQDMAARYEAKKAAKRAGEGR